MVVHQVTVVRAQGLGQVLDQVTTARDVDDLGAPADREQRDAVLDRDPGQGEVERVLRLVDVVLRVVRLLTRPVGCEISPARSRTPSAIQIRSRTSASRSSASIPSGTSGWRTSGSAPASCTARISFSAETSAR